MEILGKGLLLDSEKFEMYSGERIVIKFLIGIFRDMDFTGNLRLLLNGIVDV